MKKVRLKVNGLARQVIATPELTLLDLLRDGLHLTGAKQACDRAGQCGACTVISNGRAVRSCLIKVENLDGADVITVEGLGTPDNPHLIQEAFVLSGAIQCGFCTPGMIMSTKALLDRNLDPTSDQIKHALMGNLCRCTGYAKIIDAVKLAARFLRGEATPAQVRPDPNGPKIGVSHPRPSAMPLACGVAQFSGDYMVPGALEVAAVRSPHAHANIKGIDFAAAEKMPGVVGVLTAKDIKGTNRLKSAIPDRPVFCEDRVRSIGDPVMAVVAESLEQARAAARAVVVDYEELPAYLSPQEAMAEGAIQINPLQPNLFHNQRLIKGDAEGALAGSAAVIEAHFKTQLNHQAPLEPEAALAYFEGEGEDARLVVIGRSINIHKHLEVLQEAVGWEDMRYEEAFSGGQFGIKVEITSEAIAAAGAIKFRRPVRYIPSLAESMAMTPKRHPFDMKFRLGADSEGHLTALTAEHLVEKGAYLSSGTGPLNRAILMGAGSYDIPNLRFAGRVVHTNNTYGSAARGAGPPQQHFGLECAVNMLAFKMGIDPLEFRQRNSLRPCRFRSCGRPVELWPIPELCEAIKPHYERSRQEAAQHRTGILRRGVGLAAGSFGIGGPGEPSTLAVELDPDGGVTVYGSVADPGEGNDSMLTQLAAHVMELPLSKVRLVIRDSERKANTNSASGSRMTYMGGGALVSALDQMKKAMQEVGATDFQTLKQAGRATRYVVTKVNTDTTPRNPETGEGPNYDSEVFAVQLAELEVNTETGGVSVIKMTCAVDAGTIINPHNVEGQLEGGMDQGVGWALREQFIPGQTKDWATFKFPTMRTAFDTEVIFRETPRPRGTRGATGIGEMTLIPTAPAIIGAIHDACGVWICDLPATPAKIKAALSVGK